MVINKSLTSEDSIDIKLVAFITLIYVINAFAVNNETVGLALGVIEYSVILFLFVIGRVEKAVLLYLIFLTTSIEMQAFVFGYGETSNLYGFLALPKLGIYPLFALNIGLFIKLYLTNGKTIVNFGQCKNLKRIYIWSWIIFIMGIFMMFITLLFNDNGILNLSWYSDKLKSELFRLGMIFLTFQNFIGMLLKYNNFNMKLKKVALHILVAMIPATILTIMFGLHGYYGTSKDVILMPLVTIFGVGILLFSVYANTKYKIQYICLGVIFIFIMLNYSTPMGGKWILLLLSVPLIMIIKNMKSKKITNYMAVIVLTLGIVIFIQYLPRLFEDNTLLSRKFTQVMSLLLVTQPDWYANMSGSPKFRIDEFINILYEYYNKPYYFLFGKGHGGTLLQYTSTLDWNNPGAFTLDESSAGVFMRLHSSINLIFIKYGLIGIMFFINMIYLCIKNIQKNPWIVIGLIWFTLFYGVYTTLLYGAVVLILGVYEAENNNKVQGI